MSAAFSRWFAANGAGMDEAAARKVWNAAITEAFDRTLTEALILREQSLCAANDTAADFAAARFMTARSVSSVVFGLRS